MNDLSLRVVTALVLALFALLLTYFGGLPFIFLVLIVGAFMLYEWLEITDVHVDLLTTLFAYLAYALSVIALIAGIGDLLFFALLLLACLVIAYSGWRRDRELWAAFGVAYTCLSVLALVGLREHSTPGLLLVIYLFVVVWMTDVGAYFLGRAIGGPKLAPGISPKKTWSGAIGGVISALIAAVIFGVASSVLSYATLIVLAFVISVASQVGDLFESWVKRRFDKKDSSHLLPGHGGILDRVDGLVLAAMTLYFLSQIIPIPAYLYG